MNLTVHELEAIRRVLENHLDQLPLAEKDVNAESALKMIALELDGEPVKDGRPYLRPTDEVELSMPGHGLVRFFPVAEATADGTSRFKLRSLASAIRRDGAEIWRLK
jgi:hypothetical protein